MAKKKAPSRSKPKHKKPTAKAKPARAPKKSKPAPRVVAKKPVAPKATSKPTVSKHIIKIAAESSVSASKSVPESSGKKGITVVDPKPVKKVKKPEIGSVAPPSVGRLLDPKNPIRKPLIASGPKATHVRPLGMQAPEAPELPRPVVKTIFGKRDLQRFRALLLRKRAELIGDVSMMESEALQGSGGASSSVPQHPAEQGSDAYDQSLSLDLAAADRKLIREIEDAIKRIDAGTYGICELTGKPIKIDRLEELPWARYSIEAQRELERRSMRA